MAVKKDVQSAQVHMVDPKLLLPAEGNRAVDRDSQEFIGLVASVAEVGVRIPVMAVLEKGGKYRLRAGHRRTAAAVKANELYAAGRMYARGDKGGQWGIIDHKGPPPACSEIPVL